MCSYVEGRINKLALGNDDGAKLGKFQGLTVTQSTYQLRKSGELTAFPSINEHEICLDADPFVPNACEIVEHKKGGIWKWNAGEVQCYLSEKKNGNVLRKELADKPVFNANALDYFLKNPHLVSEDWKGKAVFFWGTIYRSGDKPFVRYLYLRGSSWSWFSLWLDDDFVGCYHALRAS